MRTVVGAVLLFAGTALFSPSIAQAGEWETFKAPRYGFEMLVPKGTKLAGSAAPWGWGCLHAKYEGVDLYGFAQLGLHYEPEEIEKFGVKATGVAADYWKVIDKGKTRGNWTWYRTVKATDGKKVLYGIYGIGPRGSYLLVLKTTAEDFAANEASYKKWYDSLKLKGGWSIYGAKAYGLTMLVPENAKLTEKEDSEWGYLEADVKGVKLYACAHETASAEEIQNFGVKVTGLGSDNWTHIDEGKGVRGWKWFKTVKASEGDKLAVGIYGTGPRGSYLFLVKTTKSDYEANKGAYNFWYTSCHLQ